MRIVDTNGVTRQGDWIQTASGKQCFPLDPDLNVYTLFDVASALSKITRFGGHCLQFYSVAEHCVVLTREAMRRGADQRLARAMLFHDASEAYLIDVPRPIKRSLGVYLEIEDNLMRAIAKTPAFDFDYPLPTIVKEYDTNILNDEMNQIMAPPPAPWSHGGVPLGVTLQCWSPAQAFSEFCSLAVGLGAKP